MNIKQANILRPSPWENPRFRNWIAVAKAGIIMERAVAAALKPLDLKTAQLDMMMNIHRHPGLSQQELAEKLIVGRSNVTMLMPSLLARGLVERKSDGKDKRIQRLQLTNEGQELLAEALSAYSAVIDKAMSATTPKECDFIGEVMAKLVKQMTEN